MSVIVSMRESEISPLIDEICRGIPDVYVKPLIKDYGPDSGLPIKILAFGEGRSACARKLASVIEHMRTFAEARRRDVALVKGMPRGRARRNPL